LPPFTVALIAFSGSAIVGSTCLERAIASRNSLPPIVVVTPRSSIRGRRAARSCDQQALRRAEYDVPRRRGRPRNGIATRYEKIATIYLAGLHMQASSSGPPDDPDGMA
jgi:hypothetical protein